MNNKQRKPINWEKAIAYGITFGFMASTLYLLLMIAVKVG